MRLADYFLSGVSGTLKGVGLCLPSFRSEQEHPTSRYCGSQLQRTQLFGGYNTRFPLFGQSSSGVSYNVTLNGGDGTIDACGFTPYLDLSSTYWSSLVYVMTVVVAHGRRQTFAYRKSLLGFSGEHTSRAFIVVDNFSNLLNDWGVLYKPNFPHGVTQDVIEAGRTESRIGGASLWEIRVVFNYNF